MWCLSAFFMNYSRHILSCWSHLLWRKSTWIQSVTSLFDYMFNCNNNVIHKRILPCSSLPVDMHFRALALRTVFSYLAPAAFSITQKQFGAFLLMGGSSALLLQLDSWPSSQGASSGRLGCFIHMRGARKTAGPLLKWFSHLKRITFPIEIRHLTSLLL